MSVDSLLRIGRFNGTYNGTIYRYTANGQLAYPYYNPNVPPFTVKQQNVRNILLHQAFIWSVLKDIIYPFYNLYGNYYTNYIRYTALTFADYTRTTINPFLRNGFIANDSEGVNPLLTANASGSALLNFCTINYTIPTISGNDTILDNLFCVIVALDGSIVYKNLSVATRGATLKSFLVLTTGLTINAVYKVYLGFSSYTSYGISKVLEIQFTAKLL